MIKTSNRIGILLATLLMSAACTSGYLSDTPNMRIDLEGSRRIAELAEDDYLELRIFNVRDIQVERDDLKGTSYRILGNPKDLRGQSVFRIPLSSRDEQTGVSIPHVPIGPQYRIIVLNSNARFGAVSSAFRMSSRGVTTVQLSIDRITDLDNPEGPGADLVLEADSPEDIASVFGSGDITVYELLGLTIDASGLDGDQYEWLIDGNTVGTSDVFDYHDAMMNYFGPPGTQRILTLRVSIDGNWYSDSVTLIINSSFNIVSPAFGSVLEFSSEEEDVRLSWEEVPGALFYNVYINIYYNDDQSWYDIMEIEDTSVVLESLPADAEILVFLEAESDEGRQIYSPELWFYTELLGGGR
ncbi:hypothetical protein [Spirochaeta dissipatitropha]